MTQDTRTRPRFYGFVLALMATLAFAIAACGGGSTGGGATTGTGGDSSSTTPMEPSGGVGY